MKNELDERVREATGDLAEGLSIEIVDIEIKKEKGRLFLRISIDSPGGVTLDDCARTSELMGEILERESIMPGSYILEVMSPGLNRPLKKREDFDRSVGKRITVRLRQPFEGRSRITGFLRNAGDDSFTLDTGDETMELKYETLSRARLDPELPW
jgi:ribosome maturation factor RimP